MINHDKPPWFHHVWWITPHFYRITHHEKSGFHPPSWQDKLNPSPSVHALAHEDVAWAALVHAVVLIPRRTDGGLRLWRLKGYEPPQPPQKMVEVGKKITLYIYIYTKAEKNGKHYGGYCKLDMDDVGFIKRNVGFKKAHDNTNHDANVTCMSYMCVHITG